MEIVAESKCSTCKQMLPLARFYKRHDGLHNGIGYVCRGCHLAQRATLAKNNPERRKKYAREHYARHKNEIRKRRNTDEWKAWSKAYHLKRMYGLSIEAYEAMLVAQQFSCKICARHMTQVTRGCLVVDHDHVTGRIRGLLCIRCNSGLGTFDDDLEMFKKIVSYLNGGAL